VLPLAEPADECGIVQTVAVHCDNQAEHKNKLCGQTTDYLTLNLAAYILTIGLLSGYKIYYRGLDLFRVSDVKQMYPAIAQQLNVITFLVVSSKSCTIMERNFKHKICLIQRKKTISVI
jgi:hypothetical protein